MKTAIFKYGDLDCLCCLNPDADNVAYILTPMPFPDNWLELTAAKYKTSVVAIGGMDWDNDLTPWPASGQPEGSPDFMGLASDFLSQLINDVVPSIEHRVGISHDTERTLIGISLSGLFTLWQWPQNDMFANIATLSGSFWYDGFTEWVCRQSFTGKHGKCFMLLGREEPFTRNRVFRRVGECTEQIVAHLRQQGVNVEFEWVPGNHYQDAIPRLNRTFARLFHPESSTS